MAPQLERAEVQVLRCLVTAVSQRKGSGKDKKRIFIFIFSFERFLKDESLKWECYVVHPLSNT